MHFRKGTLAAIQHALPVATIDAGWRGQIIPGDGRDIRQIVGQRVVQFDRELVAVAQIGQRRFHPLVFVLLIHHALAPAQRNAQ